jgi:membrane fusion protein, multidrug efflux system
MIWRLIVAVVLLVVVVGGIVGFNVFRDQAIQGYFASMQPPPVTVSVIEAKAAPWQPELEAIGTANAAQGVDLGIEAAGIVREILFKANDRVEQGQRLFQIDDRVERADLEAARARLSLAQETLKRVETLRERGVVPVSDLDVARADAANASAVVVRLQAVLEQKALEAPFSGMIGIPKVEVGGYVETGTVYATLQDIDTMRVDFSIPEQQIRLIEIGMPVIVSSEVGGTELDGQIVAIEPKIDPNSRLVGVRAVVEEANGQINPGQFLRVRVQQPVEPSVIALPQTTVTSNLYGDSVYVVRKDGEAEDAPLKVEQVFVDAGRRARGLVEIARGLEPGDQVVTAGQNRLSGGATVVIDNTVNPATADASAAAATATH